MGIHLRIIGVGQPVVLLHAFPLNSQMFHLNQLPGYQFIFPDFPGFGYSTFIEPDVNMGVIAEALNRRLNEILDPDKILVLGGISMGGYLAFEYLRKFPEKVSKLILISTRAGLDTPQAKQNRIAMAEKVENIGLGLLPEALPKGLLGMTTQNNNPVLVEAVKRFILSSTPNAFASAQRVMANRCNQTDILPNIKQKTLVLAGSEDGLIPVAETKFMASLIPNAQFRLIEHVGHLIPLEDPEEFQSLIAEFLLATS